MEDMLITLIEKITDVNTGITLCLVLTITDTITGIWKHYVRGDFKSSEVRKGFITKISWYLAILFGFSMYVVLKNNLLMITIISACCFTEASSIVENFNELGVDIKNRKEDKKNDESK